MEEYKRKPISKAMRQKVYEKYNGRCAYCGSEIESTKDMQVDHIIPIAHSIYGQENKVEKVRQMFEDNSINEIDNLMPACRACNYYKGTNDIEGFRQRILRDLDHTCRSSFQTRLAIKYGMITYKPWGGKFYFEENENKENEQVN